LEIGRINKMLLGQKEFSDMEERKYESLVGPEQYLWIDSLNVEPFR
jgi:hypothetical protein